MSKGVEVGGIFDKVKKVKGVVKLPGKGLNELRKGGEVITDALTYPYTKVAEELNKPPSERPKPQQKQKDKIRY